MLVRGSRGQRIIWDSYMEFYGLDDLISLLTDKGLADPTRQAQNMRDYWEDNGTQNARPGHVHFPDMLWRLTEDRADPPFPGNWSAVEGEEFVTGTDCLHLILDQAPEFQPVFGQSYDPTSIFDSFSYLLGFSSSISRFVVYDGDFWIAYLGESDSVVPDVCNAVNAPTFITPSSFGT